jgi:hypothetical protein
MRNAGR